jgi:hypothetical protein
VDDTQRIGGIDKRWVFVLVAVGALIPIIHPLGLPVKTTPAVEALFEYMEGLERGDVVMLSFDYGPSSAPELDPMANAILRHCFTRDLRVVVVALFPLGGDNQAKLALETVVPEFDVVEGRDYTYLGYKDGGLAVLRGMATDISAVFPVDDRSIPYNEIPMLEGVRNYDDLKISISLATGIFAEWWAINVNAQYGLPVAVGATAVSAPKYYAYLNAGQMLGLLGGLKGAAEYETLLGEVHPELSERSVLAIRGMDVQSIVHLIIIGFIILGNIVYFVSRSERTRAGGRLGSR